MGTAVTPDGARLLVTTGRSKQLLIINTKTSAIEGSVEAGQRPWGIAVSADGKTAYTANGPSNELAVIDLEGLRVKATVPVGNGPWGAVFVQRPAATSTR